MAYKRWYDFDVRLSSVVRTVEMMDYNTQKYLAGKLLEVSEDLLVRRGGEKYLAKLDEKKKEGLKKASARNRWYDQLDNLHQAFNNMYALPNEDRQALAAQLTTPIKIVEAYERHCRSEKQDPDLKVVEQICRTSMTQGNEHARKLYALYLYDYGPQKKAGGVKPKPKDEPKGMWTALLENLQYIVGSTPAK